MSASTEAAAWALRARELVIGWDQLDDAARTALSPLDLDDVTDGLGRLMDELMEEYPNRGIRGLP